MALQESLSELAKYGQEVSVFFKYISRLEQQATDKNSELSPELLSWVFENLFFEHPNKSEVEHNQDTYWTLYKNRLGWYFTTCLASHQDDFCELFNQYLTVLNAANGVAANGVAANGVAAKTVSNDTQIHRWINKQIRNNRILDKDYVLDRSRSSYGKSLVKIMSHIKSESTQEFPMDQNPIRYNHMCMDFVYQERPIYEAIFKKEEPTNHRHQVRTKFKEQWMKCLAIVQQYRERVILVWYAKLTKLSSVHRKATPDSLPTIKWFVDVGAGFIKDNISDNPCFAIDGLKRAWDDFYTDTRSKKYTAYIEKMTANERVIIDVEVEAGNTSQTPAVTKLKRKTDGVGDNDDRPTQRQKNQQPAASQKPAGPTAKHVDDVAGSSDKQTPPLVNKPPVNKPPNDQHSSLNNLARAAHVAEQSGNLSNPAPGTTT